MDKKIRTMLIEDHRLLRSGLRSLFEKSNEIIVVAEAENGKEGIEKAKTHKPDVVIVDLGLDDMPGVEVARTIIDNNPETKIVVLTSHQNANEVVETLRAGVNAYVIKDIADEILIMIIKSVAQGAIWLDPKVVDIARKNSSGVLPVKTYSRASFKAQHANLTEREYEVLKLVVEGKSNQQIAQILNISEHTSKAHVCSIIQKLVVDDRTQAAVKAIKEGIV